jgi:REP element-mobilizing transposase RayT
MSRWKLDYDPSHLYFVTTTAIHRVHLFKRDVIRRLIVDVLDMVRILRSLELYAFAVMPNHAHFIVQCTTEYTISDLMREFKSSVANRIVWQYQASARFYLLGEPALIPLSDATQLLM